MFDMHSLFCPFLDGVTQRGGQTAVPLDWICSSVNDVGYAWQHSQFQASGSNHPGCRAVAVGVIAVGSKVAVIAKSAGGAGGLLKGIGALAAAGTGC